MADDYTCLWIRVGDAGEYEKFDDLDAAIEYLNELCVGKITDWIQDGFETVNFHGRDYISCYWGVANAHQIPDLDDSEKEHIENGLEKNYL